MAKFTLNCDCGCDSFHIVRGLEDDTVQLVCESCKKPLANVNSYSMHWVEEEQDAEDAD